MTLSHDVIDGLPYVEGVLNMAALKRSLAQQAPASKRLDAVPRKAAKTKPDRRQPALLLAVSGGRKRKTEDAADRPTSAPRRRKRA